jgi:small subunit ribosomal protein S7
MSGKEQVNIKLFNKWDTTKIEVTDIGLSRVISLKPASVIPITFGRHEHQRLKKSDVNIIERLSNKMMHFGKKYGKGDRKCVS